MTDLKMFGYHCSSVQVSFRKLVVKFGAVLHSLAEVPLPGPPNPPLIDESLTDLELFRKHCLPILDLWPEAWIDSTVFVFMDSYWMNEYV